MYPMANDQREIRRKLRILEHAKATGKVSKTCRYFGIARAHPLAGRERSTLERNFERILRSQWVSAARALNLQP
jgi:hypothetical protein